jgi:YD repeat-containing protein
MPFAQCCHWTFQKPRVHFVNPQGDGSSTVYKLSDRRMFMNATGGRHSYTHDAKGRLTLLTNPQARRTSFTFDPLDRAVLTVQGNGTITSQAYDPAGQLLSVWTSRGNGVTLSRLTYTYDPTARRKSVTDLGGRTSWTYDHAYQLSGEQRSGSATYNVTWTYDPAGNRLLQNDTGQRTSYVYDAADQLQLANGPTGVTSYVYDACGNRKYGGPRGGLHCKHVLRPRDQDYRRCGQ